MNDPVSHMNLDYYRKRLANEADSTIRQILIRLIAEEEARLSQQNEMRVAERRDS